VVTPDRSIVVVGAGHAGFQLTASLRQSGCQERIYLINDEPHLPYQRPPLSKAFLQGSGEPDTVAFRPEAFFRDHQIDLVSDHVCAVDRVARRMTLQSCHSLEYGHLVFATGARNRVLTMPNAEHDDVRYLRSLSDSETIRQRLGVAKRVVVIGAGFIGLEFAATAAARGLEVDIVELAPRVMARVVSPAVSQYFQMQHEVSGCRIHCGRSVSAIETGKGRLRSVILDDGKRIAADLVVVGIGVAPNVEVAVAAGLPSENGIVVNQHLASVDPHISAIGDCALFSSSRYGAPVRLESVANATDQAKCLAARLTGHIHPFDSVPWFWSDQGKDKLQIAGLIDRCEEAIIRGEPDQKSFSVFCYGGGNLLGVESVNRVGDHMIARRLLAARASLHPNQAASLSYDLKGALQA
jgi:3-phenylpropionate/trans-cinnamate dioxygenase ferredoxin reductase subunit